VNFIKNIVTKIKKLENFKILFVSFTYFLVTLTITFTVLFAWFSLRDKNTGIILNPITDDRNTLITTYIYRNTTYKTVELGDRNLKTANIYNGTTITNDCYEEFFFSDEELALNKKILRRAIVPGDTLSFAFVFTNGSKSEGELRGWLGAVLGTTTNFTRCFSLSVTRLAYYFGPTGDDVPVVSSLYGCPVNAQFTNNENDTYTLFNSFPVNENGTIQASKTDKAVVYFDIFFDPVLYPADQPNFKGYELTFGRVYAGISTE
jgi:hypothetical protein